MPDRRWPSGSTARPSRSLRPWSLSLYLSLCGSGCLATPSLPARSGGPPGPARPCSLSSASCAATPPGPNRFWAGSGAPLFDGGDGAGGVVGGDVEVGVDPFPPDDVQQRDRVADPHDRQV